MWRGKGAAGTARVGWRGTRGVSNSEDRVVGVGEREGVSKEIEGTLWIGGWHYRRTLGEVVAM